MILQLNSHKDSFWKQSINQLTNQRLIKNILNKKKKKKFKKKQDLCDQSSIQKIANATTQKYKNKTQPKWNYWGFNKRNSNKISIQLFSRKINYVKSTIVLLIFVQKFNSTKYTNSNKYTTKKIHHFPSNQSNFLYPFIIFPLTKQLQNQIS